MNEIDAEGSSMSKFLGFGKNFEYKENILFESFLNIEIK